jgi:hypothetical protein
MLLRLIALLALVVLFPTLATGANAGAGGPSPTPTVTSMPTASPTPPATVAPSITGVPTATATTVPSITTIVGTAADLVLTVQASPNPVPNNGILTYFITVSNQGGTTSPPTRLTASIPAGTTLNTGLGCFINPTTGLQDCSGTSLGTCFVNPTTGAIDCSNLGGNCFANPTTGALTCTGTNLPGNCFVNPTTGAVTCSGSGLPIGCFVNPSGFLTCPTPTQTPTTGNCFINPSTGQLQCSNTTIGSGCTQVTVGNIVDCPIPSLAPGASTSLTLSFQVTAGSGTVFQQVRLDPENLVQESNEANNTVSVAVGVSGTISGTSPLSPIFEAPTPTATTVPPIVAQPVPPIQPTVVPAPTQAPQGALWLRVMQPTQAYSVTMDPLWIAQPGEWYFVVRQEAGWALAVWEGDTADWSVWIQMDARVEVTIADRPIPQLPLWLAVVSPTQVYSITMDPLWTAMPGERYRVREQEEGWALVIWEGDPPDMQEWIQVDTRVTLTRM